MNNYTFGNVDFPPSIGEGILELFWHTRSHNNRQWYGELQCADRRFEQRRRRRRRDDRVRLDTGLRIVGRHNCSTDSSTSSSARTPLFPERQERKGGVNIITRRSRMESRHVRFSHLVVVRHPNDEDEDGCSQWIRVARDRQHFKRRIERLSSILEPVLVTEHRLKVILRNRKV